MKCDKCGKGMVFGPVVGKIRGGKKVRKVVCRHCGNIQMEEEG